jgi:hypothetical protein
MKATGDRAILFTANYPNNFMKGIIDIECPYLENNSAIGLRAAIYFGANLNNKPGYVSGDFKIIIRIGTIFMSSDAVSDATISGGVWLDGGDNIYVYADIVAKKCMAVCNRGGGGTFFGNGNVVFTGVLSSEKEVVSAGAKYANGNGWNNLIFKNCTLKSKGIGVSNSIVETGVLGGWNGAIGGTMGKMYFENCKFINEYSVNDKPVYAIVDKINSPGTDIRHMFLYNSMILLANNNEFSYSIDATKTNSPNKEVGLHNVRSNKDIEDVTITNVFSENISFVVDENLTFNSF